MREVNVKEKTEDTRFSISFFFLLLMVVVAVLTAVAVSVVVVVDDAQNNGSCLFVRVKVEGRSTASYNKQEESSSFFIVSYSLIILLWILFPMYAI